MREPRHQCPIEPMHAAHRCQDMSCSLRMASRQWRFTCSPGTWDALRLPLDKNWHGVARAEYPRSPGPASGPGERRTQAHGRVLPSEAQAKPGGTVRRESERLIVPTKPGNSPRGDPAEGRRRRVAELLGGNMAGTQRPEPVSTKQQQIAELAACGPRAAVRGEPVTRRAGCLNWARPDLWEGREETPSPTRPIPTNTRRKSSNSR